MKTLKLDFDKQVVASCCCLTKTPDPQYHDELCYYKLLMEHASHRPPSYAPLVRKTLQNCHTKIELYNMENQKYLGGIEATRLLRNIEEVLNILPISTQHED